MLRGYGILQTATSANKGIDLPNTTNNIAIYGFYVYLCLTIIIVPRV